jgi:archaellum component FlaF (FlaF/FlaG flagellin family)
MGALFAVVAAVLLVAWVVTIGSLYLGHRGGA